MRTYEQKCENVSLDKLYLVPESDVPGSACICTTKWVDNETHETGVHKSLHFMTKRAEYIIVDEPRPCRICGSLTNKIDICTEAYFCTDKCHKVFDDEFERWCNTHPMSGCV